MTEILHPLPVRQLPKFLDVDSDGIVMGGFDRDDCFCSLCVSTYSFQGVCKGNEERLQLNKARMASWEAIRVIYCRQAFLFALLL
jgi:hypothetical protein